MKAWPGTFFAFDPHVVAAVVQHIGNIGKEIRNVLRGDPLCRYLGVVIVTVSGQRIGNLKICGAAVVVFVPCADHIRGKSLLCGDFIRDFNFVGISAVGCIADAVCRIYDDWLCFGHGAITPFSVLFVQPIIQCSPGNQPPLPYAAVWDDSAPQQPHQGWDADPQVSRSLFEVEYGLIGTRLHVFRSFLLCLAVLSHIIEP